MRDVIIDEYFTVQHEPKKLEEEENISPIFASKPNERGS